MKYIAYTDGYFGMGDRVGASACIVLSDDMSRILHRWAKARRCKPSEKKQLNNEQELGAFVHAVQSVPDGSELLIRSDSMYCVKVLGGVWKAKTNEEIIKVYTDTVRRKKLSVKTEWVRGHNGDTYNEAADGLCDWLADYLRKSGKNVLSWKEGDIAETK